LFLLGFAPDGGCPAAALLRTPVVSYTTISPLPGCTRQSGRFVSVAHPAGCPAPGVTRHRALWSADFPRPREKRSRDHPTDLRVMWW